MKVTAAIMVNLDESPLGTRSRLADSLSGVPILRRTVQRAVMSPEIDRLHVVVPQAQAGRVGDLLAGLPVEVETHAAGPSAHQSLTRAGRWWGLDSWRGGAGAFCAFDEDFHAPVLAALAKKTNADAIVTIPAAAPLFDAAMLDGIVRHSRDVDEPTGITFVQAPPGLGGFLVRRDILEQLAATTVPPGAILAYSPARPAGDMTGRETCYRPSADVIQARGRVLCDTKRSSDRVQRLIDAGAENWDSARIGRWLSEVDSKRVEAVPREIEIELTTDVPAGWRSHLRPIGVEGVRRGPIDRSAIAAVAEWIGDYDDVCVVLGGFGDPCLHPQFGEICRELRRAGAAAIAVRTTGLVAGDAIDAALFETPVDLVEVMLDAADAKTYTKTCGLDGYDKALSILESRLGRRERENRVRPLWVPSMVKAVETFDDLEPFVDTWQRRLGMYLVTGHCHCAGQRPRREVTAVAPPVRTACRRVFSRAVVLADGHMTTCDQDFRGVQAIGRISDRLPRELWLESSHLCSIRREVIADTPLCGACDEWHRP